MEGHFFPSSTAFDSPSQDYNAFAVKLSGRLVAYYYRLYRAQQSRFRLRLSLESVRVATPSVVSVRASASYSVAYTNAFWSSRRWQ
jgi:hypothetical protein